MIDMIRDIHTSFHEFMRGYVQKRMKNPDNPFKQQFLARPNYFCKFCIVECSHRCISRKIL